MTRVAVTLALLAVLVIVATAAIRDLETRRRRTRLERLRAAFMHRPAPDSPRHLAGLQTVGGGGLRLTLPARWKVENDGAGRLLCAQGLAGSGRLSIATESGPQDQGWGDEEPLDGGLALAKRLDTSPDARRITYAWCLRDAAGRTHVARLEVDSLGADDVLVQDDVAAVELGLREALCEPALGELSPRAS